MSDAEYAHTRSDLYQMQAMPLSAKIRMTQNRIRGWAEHWEGQVYVSWSGGKDSTVLKHIIDHTPGMYDVPAVFVNTGLEYPEIQRFVRDVKDGKYGDIFNTDIEILRPEMRFDEVIKKYGYPVGTKRASTYAETARRNPDSKRAKWLSGEAFTKFVSPKWSMLIDAPFMVSGKCCDIMKKKPAKEYESKTGRVPIIGTMASESINRENLWLKNGCNSFDSKRPKSQPLSFWTDQDVLEYIVKYDLPYAKCYGQIQPEGQIEGQMYIDGFHEKLCTSGCTRTGCMFCMFGVHLEKEPNRFQRMKQTHPKQWEYCMKPIEEGGLGLKNVLEYICVKYE